MSSDEEKVPRRKRLCRKVTGAFGRAWGWFGRQGSALWNNLPAMWGVTILTALLTATYVTYLSGLPWRLEWDSGASRQCHAGTILLKRCWQFEPLSMDDRLKVAAGVITGIAALTALLVSYRKQLNLESTQFDDDLAKAVNQLAHASPSVRIAGVYAVAGLADRTHDRRQECVDVLCGYLRVPCSLEPKDTALHSVVEAHFSDSGNLVERSTQYTPYDKEVRNTIVRLMKNHLQPDARKSWSDLRFDFTGAHLFEADFSGAQFGYVTFVNALVAGPAWFDNARFTRYASFYSVTFTQTAKFSNVTFTQDTTFRDAIFTQDAWFEGTTFTQDTTFRDAIFTQDAWFEGTTFAQTAWFLRTTFAQTAKFSNVTFTKDGRFFSTTFTKDARFEGTTFAKDAWFEGTTFAKDARFEGTTFTKDAWFDSARFSVEPRFPRSRFARRPDFTNATLQGMPFDPFEDHEDDSPTKPTDTTDLRPFDEAAEDSPPSD